MKFVRKGRRVDGSFRRRRVGRIPGYMGSRAARVETKVVDLTPNSYQLTSTAGVLSMNSIASGSDVYQRVGRQISMTSVHVRAYLQDSGNVQNNEQIRYAIVYDRQPDGIAPVWADVFQDVDNAGTGTSDSWAFTNVNYWNRFKVLAEGLVSPQGLGGGSYAPSIINDQQQKIIFDRYVKLPNLVARFISAAAAVPTTGGIFFMFKGLYAAMTNPYVIAVQGRLCYKDV
jgi:hypothetical protein